MRNVSEETIAYNYKDVIINPYSEATEAAIGKLCYFSVSPKDVLDTANRNKGEVSTLIGVKDGYFLDEDETRWDCIIVSKDEPKPKFVPFENAEEFLDAYYHNETKNLNGIYHYLATRGIWLKDKSTEVGVYCMVTKVWDSGLVICSVKMSTDGTIEFNNITSWSELYENFTFLDGSPCGNLKGTVTCSIKYDKAATLVNVE